MATINATDNSNPVTVAQGGTGDSSLTAYAVVVGGTTSTAPLQSVASVGTAGQVLTSGGASALPVWSNAAGSMVLLHTDTASNSASLSFSGYITSAYTTYFIEIVGINNATGTTTFNMQFSTAGGPLSSGYNAGLNYNYYNSSTMTNVSSTTICPLTYAISGTTIPINGYMFLNLPQSGASEYYGQAYISESTAKSETLFGLNSGVAAITNITFSYSSGNITSGTISLYGIQQ